MGKSIPRHILCAAGYKAQPPRNHACELRCESPVLAHIPHAQPVTRERPHAKNRDFLFCQVLSASRPSRSLRAAMTGVPPHTTPCVKLEVFSYEKV